MSRLTLRLNSARLTRLDAQYIGLPEPMKCISVRWSARLPAGKQSRDLQSVDVTEAVLSVDRNLQMTVRPGVLKANSVGTLCAVRAIAFIINGIFDTIAAAVDSPLFRKK